VKKKTCLLVQGGRHRTDHTGCVKVGGEGVKKGRRRGGKSNSHSWRDRSSGRMHRRGERRVQDNEQCIGLDNGLPGKISGEEARG